MKCPVPHGAGRFCVLGTLLRAEGTCIRTRPLSKPFDRRETHPVGVCLGTEQRFGKK